MYQFATVFIFLPPCASVPFNSFRSRQVAVNPGTHTGRHQRPLAETLAHDASGHNSNGSVDIESHSFLIGGATAGAESSGDIPHDHSSESQNSAPGDLRVAPEHNHTHTTSGNNNGFVGELVPDEHVCYLPKLNGEVGNCNDLRVNGHFSDGFQANQNGPEGGVGGGNYSRDPRGGGMSAGWGEGALKAGGGTPAMWSAGAAAAAAEGSPITCRRVPVAYRGIPPAGGKCFFSWMSQQRHTLRCPKSRSF